MSQQLTAISHRADGLQLDPFSRHPGRIAQPFGAAMTAATNDAARDAAAQFVGMAFIQPLLAQLRETSTAAGPFAPTSAEKRFGPLMDQMLSDRIAGATNFDLVDSVARRLTAMNTYGGGGA